jgi:hypothetical protein
MSRLFLNFMEFQGETFSDGERMAVRGKREVEDPPTPRWKRTSIRKS